MPPEPGSPADWLRYARSDLALARSLSNQDVLLETLCYHLQQAAEKSLKAVLVHRGIDFPRTHDLRTLLDLLSPSCAVPEAVESCARLTVYAVIHRYPGEYEPITFVEYQSALATAEATLAWAASLAQE